MKFQRDCNEIEFAGSRWSALMGFGALTLGALVLVLGLHQGADVAVSELSYRIIRTQADERPDETTDAPENIVAPGFSQEPEVTGTVPPLVEVSPMLDFGYIAPESFVSGIVTLMNESDETITLTKARGDCECTVPVIDKPILAPGEATDIIINLDAPHNLGRIMKKVFVEVEGFDLAFTLWITAEMGHPVRVNGGENRSIIVELVGEYTLDSINMTPFSILAINGHVPTSDDFKNFDPELDEPKIEYTVRYDFTDTEIYKRPRFVVIETDLPGAEMFDFPAFLPGVSLLPKSDNWWPRKKRLLLNTIEPGQWAKTSLVVAGLLPKPGDKISLMSSNPDIAARVANVRRPDHGQGLHLDLEFLPRWGLIGFTSSILTFEMADQYVTVEVFARVSPPPEPKVSAEPGVIETNKR